MLACPNCGKIIFEGTKKCPACKSQIEYVNPKSENPADFEKSPKTKKKAGLLQIFLGFLGMGRFYTGHYEIAIFQILLSLCFGLGYIWAIVDGILILTGKFPFDSKHRTLQ